MSDDWASYLVQIEDKPAAVLVDLGLASFAPIADLGQLVMLRLQIQQPTEDGLPGDDEFNRLCEIEDALDVAIGEVGDAASVGRITVAGCRDFFVYAADGAAVEAGMKQAMAAYPEYEFRSGVREDSDWSSYFEFLYPDPAEMKMIQNGRVLASLAEAGDDFDIEREVNHWIYFTSADGRAKFVEAAQAEGFEVAEQKEDAEGEAPFSVLLSHVTAVDYGTINGAVLTLFAMAAEQGGEYDGWETSVQRGE
ncbi:DUF695 domain-containing protein [Blastopirellula retiformator]|uniref:RNase E inhibitor protein n=1 Tax=Blastopirellula retiformator TaxID=2527970 RepID=A0A5C5VLG3_9BACT|nr:DUF695 domain-containing protein [Blastopirellula retiformator]TWT38639.1 RNase E inhibitor protein [Blastopirellula retiformator]